MKIFMTFLVVGLFGTLGYLLHPVFFPAPEAVVVRAEQRDFEVRMDDGSLHEFNLDELPLEEYPKHLSSRRTVTLAHSTKKELVKVRADSRLNILKVEGDLVTVTLRDENFTGQVPLGQTDFFKRIVLARMKKQAASVAPAATATALVETPEVEEAIIEDEATPAREVIVEGLQNGEYPALNEALISEVTELSSEKSDSGTIRKVKVSYLTALFFGSETKELIVTMSDDKVIEWGSAE